MILQKIDKLIYIGNFPLISLGLFLTGLTCFIIAPINFLPYSYWTILTGIFIMGINGCLIIVPSFIELTEFSRVLYPERIEMQNYVRNFFFRFSFQIADFISPIIGSFFYSHYSFEASANFTGFITLFFWSIFSLYYKDQIKMLKEILEKEKKERDMEHRAYMLYLNQLEREKREEYKKQLTEIFNRFDEEERIAEFENNNRGDIRKIFDAYYH